MKKITLLILLIFSGSYSFAQHDDVFIKSIRKVDKIIRNGGSSQINTTIYAFDKGKLITSLNRKKVFFKYNKEGLLSEDYYINVDSDKIGKLYKYDSKGYISKVELTKNDKAIGKMEFKYEFDDNNNFTIFKDFKSFTVRPGIKFLNHRTYEMKEDVLALTVESIVGKSKNKSTSSFHFENDNLIRSNFGNKAKSKYEMSYTYDDKIGVNAMFKRSILGDKYFINSFLIDVPSIFRNISFSSKNNLLSEKIEKKSKTISVSVYTSEIEYNADSYPVKIKRTSEDGKHIIELFIEYQ